LLPLVVLYRMWTPFLVAVGFVPVHHAAAGFPVPESVFSPHAHGNPLAFVALHAVFVLVEATFLAYGWKFVEEADRDRWAQRRQAADQQAAQIRGELELAEERAAPPTRPAGKPSSSGPGPRGWRAAWPASWTPDAGWTTTSRPPPT
jgi:hypothetical protein